MNDNKKKKKRIKLLIYIMCFCMTFNCVVEVFVRPKVVYASEAAGMSALYWLLSTLVYEAWSAMGIDFELGKVEKDEMYYYWENIMTELYELADSGSLYMDDNYTAGLRVIGGYESYSTMSDFLKDFLDVYTDEMVNSDGTSLKELARYKEYQTADGKKGVALNTECMQALIDCIYEGMSGLVKSTSYSGTDVYCARWSSSNSSLRYVVNIYLNEFKFEDVPGLDEYINSYDKYILVQDMYKESTYGSRDLNPDLSDIEWYGYFTNDDIGLGFYRMTGTGTTSRPGISITNAVKVKISEDGVEVIEEGYTDVITKLTVRNYKNISISNINAWVDINEKAINALPTSYEYGVDHSGTLPESESVIAKSAIEGASGVIPISKEAVLESIDNEDYYITEDMSVAIEAIDAAIEGVKSLDISEEEKILIYPSYIDEALTNVTSDTKEKVDAQTKSEVDTMLENAPTYSPVDMTTSGLANKFPFCIPFDLVKAINMLAATSETPYFEIPIKNERLGIDESIVIDFAPFETVAAICRVVETFGFILILISITRDKIKG